MKTGTYMKVDDYLKFCDFIAGKLKATTHIHAEQLAEARKWEPKVETENHTPTMLWNNIFDETGQGICVHANEYPDRGRVIFTGYYPADEDGHNRVESSRDGAPTITVALSKCTDPEKWEAVYSDIMRRLWPDYIRVLALVRERNEGTAKANRAREATRRIIEKAGARVYQNGDGFSAPGIFSGNIGYSGSVRLTIDTDPETAAAILRLLAAKKKGADL